MADKGIIFSAPMVRALLDGTKTQTRRLAKPRSTIRPSLLDGSWADSYVLDPGNAEWLARDLPYAPGDRLYVREACRAEELIRPPVTRKATRKERELLKRTEVTAADEQDGQDGIRYLADDAWLPIENTQQAGEAWSQLFHYGNGLTKRMAGLGKGVPSIHAPRWTSRITLTVTEVRVQRLQDISEADCVAEGIEPYAGIDPDCRGYRNYADPDPVPKHWLSACDSYRTLWNSLHTEPGTRWEDDPWIVAVSFDVRRSNIDAGGGS